MLFRIRNRALARLGPCFCLLCAFGFSVTARANSIVTQVSCYPPGQPAIVDTAACSFVGPSTGLVEDSLDLSITYPTSPSDYFTLQLSENSIARAEFMPTFDYSASSFANLDLTLDTAGPERAGLMEVDALWNGSVYSMPNVSYSIGDFRAGCSGSSVFCGQSEGPVIAPNLYDFVLGQPFSLDLSFTDVLDAIYEDYQADSNASLTLKFRFLESDGTTPVSMTPEPGTLGLLCAAVSGAFLMRPRFRRRRPTPESRPRKPSRQCE